MRRLKESATQNTNQGEAKSTTLRPVTSISLSQSLHRQAPDSMGGAAMRDLSKEPPPAPVFTPYLSDFSELLSSPALTDEDRSRLSNALNLASAFDQNVSNDPAVDLAMRKMKLDYARDNLVPAELRAQADTAISMYLSHRTADLDQMSRTLTQKALEIARSTGHDAQAQSLQKELAAYGSGTASSQQHVEQMLNLVDGRQYGTPEQARSSAAANFSAIKNALLDAVSLWPREQARGVQAVNQQMSRLQGNWTDFLARTS